MKPSRAMHRCGTTDNGKATAPRGSAESLVCARASRTWVTGLRRGRFVRGVRWCFGRGPRHAVVARFARRAVSWTKWTSWTEWTPNREALHLRRTGGVHRMLRGDGLLRVDGWRLGRGPRHAVDARFARRAVTWTRWTRMDRDGHGWTRWTRTAKRCTCGGRAACIGCSGATASCGSMAGVLGAGHVTRSTLASLGGRSIGRDGLHGRNGPEPRSAAVAKSASRDRQPASTAPRLRTKDGDRATATPLPQVAKRRRGRSDRERSERDGRGSSIPMESSRRVEI